MSEHEKIPKRLRDDERLSVDMRRARARARARILKTDAGIAALEAQIAAERAGAAAAVQFLARSVISGGAGPTGLQINPAVMQDIADLTAAVVTNPGLVIKEIGRQYIEDPSTILGDIELAGIPFISRIARAAKAVRRLTKGKAAVQAAEATARVERVARAVPEAIEGAAIKMPSGRIFNADTPLHADAIEQAVSLGEEFSAASRATRGFETSTGRFVTMAEAKALRESKLGSEVGLMASSVAGKEGKAIWYGAAQKAPLEEFRVGDKSFGIRRGVDSTGPQYNVYDGEDLIASYDGNFIAVDSKARGQGVAEELMFDLRSRHPDAPVSFSRTPEAQRIDDRVQIRLEAGEAPQHSQFDPTGKVGDLGPVRAVRAVDEAGAASLGDFGGSTFDPRTGQNMSDSGKYAVSPYKMRERTFTEPPTAQDFAEFRMRNGDLLLEDKTLFVGSEFDEPTKRYILDVTMLVDDKERALRIGRATAQERIALLDGDQFPTTDVTGVDLIEAARDRNRLIDEIPSYRTAMEDFMLENLTASERLEYGRAGKFQREWLESFAKSPMPREWASMIGLGFEARDWYSLSRASLARFGPDAPRFTALLAATSPQRTVRENMAFAINVWEQWDGAGRPTQADFIRSLFKEGDTTAPNAVTALLASDAKLLDKKILEEGGLLSGLKVDPFYANLMGETQRVTIDTHMARGVGVEPKQLVKFRNRGMAASIRAGTDEFNRLSGMPFKLQPAQAQAAIWAPIKAMTEIAPARRGMTAAGELFPGGAEDFTFGANSPIGRLRKKMADTSGDFSDLIAQDARIKEALDRLGLDVPPATAGTARQETIAGAVVTVGGEDFVGMNHADAFEMARRAGKSDAVIQQAMARNREGLGFKTNTGRKVGRAEAAEIEDAAAAHRAATALPGNLVREPDVKSIAQRIDLSRSGDFLFGLTAYLASRARKGEERPTGIFRGGFKSQFDQ